MEGSVAAGGQGAGDGGQGQGTGEAAPAAAPQAPAFDPGALTAQLETMSQGQEGLRELMQQLVPAAEPENHDIDLGFLQDPMADPEVIGQQLQAIIQGEAQRIAGDQVQQAVTPLTEKLSGMEREQQVRDLAAEFPEMTQPEVAQQVVGLANQIVQAYGWPAEMAGDPRMWRMAYLAGRATDAHNQEESGGDPAAALVEGGRGPNPGAGQQVDLGEQIVNGGGRRGAGALPFG